MSSLLTNTAAMTALQTLRKIDKNLSITQNRIATGERVSAAMDNPAYWSISVGMKAQNKVLSTVKDSLGLGVAILDTAYTALADAIEHVSEILARYVALETDGVDEAAVEAEIDQRMAQIVEIALTSDFEGQNLLSSSGADVDLVSGYIKGGVGVQILSLEAYDLETAVAGITDAPSAEIALADMRNAAAQFGAIKMRLETQIRFSSQLMDAVDRGIGQLVDADMNAESARINALQVQQQLGIQALSIANSNAQNILALFRS